MNTSEHIVESYYRLCLGCFTLPDRKVLSGNNRQFDLLAYHVKSKQAYHIEVEVTHQRNWCSTQEELGAQFNRKFFGAPPNRKSQAGNMTDFEKGKSYFAQIEKTYEAVGFSPDEVKRVWVCWIVKGTEETKSLILTGKHLDKNYEIEVISLRNLVLPKLREAIDTSNYDDEILRTIGFMKQYEVQTACLPQRAKRNAIEDSMDLENIS